MLSRRQIITAVDIGTSKIRVLMGETNPKGCVSAIAIAERESGDTMSKGEIRRMSELAQKLSETLDDASNLANREIEPENIFFSISGKEIRSQKSIGSVTITNELKKIGEEEIREAIRNSHHVSLPVNTVPINFIYADFLIDGDRRVEEPFGMIGNKLEAISFCVYGNSNLVENYKTTLAEAGYQIKHKGDAFSALASANAVLSPDDFKYGVLLLDIGAGTTEYALFHGSGYFDCGVIAAGCDHIANDMAAAFDIHISKARQIIIDHLQSDDFLKKQFISIDRSGEPRKIPSISIEKVVQLRINEILEIIADRLHKTQIKQHVGRGIVICGGGAKIAMLIKETEKFFDVTVRRGEVRELDGELSKLLDPQYCCVAGLLKYGANAKLSHANRSRIINKVDRGLWSIISSSWRKIRESIKI